MPELSRITELAQASREITPPTMIVWDLPETERAVALTQAASFYDLRQHSHCEFNWAGGTRGAGTAYLDERLKPTGIVMTNAASEAWSARKPDTPHGLGRQVTATFTDLLLSEIGRPMLRCPADKDTEAFIGQVMDTSKSWASLQTARDMKGAQGSAAIVLAVEDGEPTSEPLNTRHLWVREWRSKIDWVPAEVVEQKIVTVQRETEDGIETVRVWRTRVWDEVAVYYYEDVDEDWGQDDKTGKRDGEKPIPFVEAIEHQAGRCPVVWMQNTRNTESPEGQPDFAGAYEQSDRADRVRSFATRATIANTDPTLLYKDHERVRRRNPMIRKGHGARIETSPDGDAKLLETSGASVEMAWKTYAELRHDILQTVACVIVDPDNAGSYRSGEALAMLVRRMEARASRLRIPLGDEIQQIARLWCELGRSLGVSSEEEEEAEGIVLPPRVTEDEGNPDADPKIEPFKAGRGRYVQVKWGVYHHPTMVQLQAMAGALTTANGAKPVLSARTTTELAAAYLSLGSPEDEMRRLREEREANMQQMSGAMGGASQFGELDPEGNDEVAAERSKNDDKVAEAKSKAAKSDAERKEPEATAETDD